VNQKYFMPNQSKNYYSTSLDRSRRYYEVEVSRFRKSAHKDKKRCQPYSTAVLTLKGIFILLRGWVDSGPQRGWKGYVNEKSQSHHGESNLLCSGL
jgi:hypothetical protein